MESCFPTALTSKLINANRTTAIRRVVEDAGVIFESDGKFVGVKLKIKRGKQ
jgi:hypothetical protein